MEINLRQISPGTLIAAERCRRGQENPISLDWMMRKIDIFKQADGTIVIRRLENSDSARELAVAAQLILVKQNIQIVDYY